jgi:hypothetical protein
VAKFEGLEKALKAVQSKVEDALLNEVADIVRNETVYHVYQDVYSRPESARYKRRYSQGGMGDTSNYESYVDADGDKSRTLVVTNTTPFNPYLNGVDASDGISANADRGSGLDGLVNYGDGWNGIEYDWAKDEPSRPYRENTIQDLEASKNHVKVLKAGLRKRGLTVK